MCDAIAHAGYAFPPAQTSRFQRGETSSMCDHGIVVRRNGFSRSTPTTVSTTDGRMNSTQPMATSSNIPPISTNEGSPENTDSTAIKPAQAHRHDAHRHRPALTQRAQRLGGGRRAAHRVSWG